jgi:hypothetical protein
MADPELGPAAIAMAVAAILGLLVFLAALVAGGFIPAG